MFTIILHEKNIKFPRKQETESQIVDKTGFRDKSVNKMGIQRYGTAIGI